MRLLRLLILVVVVTVCGGIFGTVIGALLGFAAPSSLQVMLGADRHRGRLDAHAPLDRQTMPAPEEGATPPSATEARVQFGVHADSTTLGMALGTAWGLVVGVVVGVILGAMDQIFLLLRFLLQKKNPAAAAAPLETSR